MPELPIRDTREILPLCGVGGCLEFSWTSIIPDPENGNPSDTMIYERLMEVEQWEIHHRYRNVELPMSGGFGSLSRRRVADDFQFVAIAAMDLTGAREALGEFGPNLTNQPFIDGRLRGYPTSAYHVGIKFNCGDPTFWTNPEAQSIARPAKNGEGVFYYCQGVLLDEVRVLDSSRGDDVVRCIVTGSGSAPLRRYVGEVHYGNGAFDLLKVIK